MSRHGVGAIPRWSRIANDLDAKQFDRSEKANSAARKTVTTTVAVSITEQSKSPRAIGKRK